MRNDLNREKELSFKIKTVCLCCFYVFAIQMRSTLLNQNKLNEYEQREAIIIIIIIIIIPKAELIVE